MIVIFLLLLLYRYNLIVPESKGLPVLLYHKISESISDDLTVSVSMFEDQIKYLKQENYNSVSLSELINYVYHNSPLPENPVIISFDDGYLNNLEYALPVLKKYNFKSVIFLPVKFINDKNKWDEGNELLLSASQISTMSNENFEFGIHSFSHTNFKNLTSKEIENEITQSINTLNDLKINFTPAFAYPYGGRPENSTVYQNMIDAFKNYNIKLAFRIGNRINPLPIRNKFEIKRISVNGNDSIKNFIIKVKKGRIKQF
ncbi:MAG TPA: polysaccharide deacetylase family protein [Ignavibacteria bacterium]|nr:polysaccharide deacetylase family protein [Ignavibacteria bacterium]